MAHPTTPNMPPLARLYILERNLRSLAKLWDVSQPIPDLKELTLFFQFLVAKKVTREKDFFALMNQHRKKGQISALREDFVLAKIAKINLTIWLEEDFAKDPNFWRTLKQKGSDASDLFNYVQKMLPDLF